MTRATARRHQPGQAAFRGILREEIDWKPFPAFAPGARLAIIVGEPTQSGPYLIRVKVPAGTGTRGIASTRSSLGDEFDTTSWWRIRPAASSSCPATRRTSTGRNQASTSRK